MIKFRTLQADEIECRVGQIKKDGFTLLLYKDARCDMNILDETVGSENWQRDHKEIKGNLYCGVSIYDEKRGWVTKWDCGTESNTEKEKGEASDSFKRSCVNWGIGRELYTAPVIRIKDNVKELSNGKYAPAFWDMRVVEIGYNEKREINKLVISGDGKTIYSFGGGKVNMPTSNVATKTPPKSNDSAKHVGIITKAEMLQKYGVSNVEETVLWFEKKLGVKYIDWTMEDSDDVRAVLQAKKDKRDRETEQYRKELKNTDGEIPFDV